MNANKTQTLTRPTIYGQNLGALKPIPLRYCLYARKSSEEDERQALSIESQIKEMLELAEKEKLNIIEIRRESHSAKDSNGRPVFNQLLQDIKTGMFNAILTWAPDRISRNAGDLGSVVDLMDQKFLHEIRTNGQIFKNSPNEKFLLMILCSQAKLENDNKGVNVKRGLRAKCEMGHRPGNCPLGYYNEKSNVRGKSRILLDTERAPVIKQIFEKVAYEFMTGRDIYRWLNYDLKFTTRTNKPLTLSGLYRILESPFYYGDFEFPVNSGNWYKGDYEPIITKELYEKARINLISAPKKYGLKEFQFTKLIKCGTCDGGITAEEKIKRLPDGSLKKYIYYHCVKKIDRECQEPYIREEELLEQIVGAIDKVEFKSKLVLEKIKKEVEKYNEMAKALGSIDMNNIKIKEKKTDTKSYIKYVLRNGRAEEKREILDNLSSKLILKDKKIILEK
ncbi:MAG: recombinase family protein [Patescibacteria group bacterium]|nr:recombinase family protein [Patescibacteria group bacterium]MDD4610474.1 recombinase family protein [Patescibacteria group bacterium]